MKMQEMFSHHAHRLNQVLLHTGNVTVRQTSTDSAFEEGFEGKFLCHIKSILIAVCQLILEENYPPGPQNLPSTSVGKRLLLMVS